MADQALSSLTNLAVSLFAARTLDPTSFGSFALATSAYYLTISVVRSLAGDVLLVRYSGAENEGNRAVTSDALAVSLGLGLGVSAVILSVGAVTGDMAVPLALAICLPLLLVQDTIRYAFVARGRPAGAFMVDLAWALAMIIGIAVAILVGMTAAVLVLAWGLAGAVAAGVGMVMLGTGPAWRGVVPWVRDHRDLWLRFLGETGTAFGSWQLILIGVAGLSGLPAAASLRAAQILFGPLHVVNTGARLVVVAEGRRVQTERAGRSHRMVTRLRDVLVIVTLAWTAAVVMMPASWGQALLRDNWQGASTVLLPFGLFMATQAVLAASSIGLRVLVRPDAALRVALVTSAALVAAGIGAAAVGGAQMVAWVLAVVGTAGSIVWWMTYRKEARVVVPAMVKGVI